MPWPLAASLVAANGTLADLDVLPDLAGAFAESQPGRNDPATLLNLIGAVVDRPLSGGSLLFLDEIQAAPHALASLRYFLKELPERPVVAGSLMEFALAEHSFPMPVGRIEYLHIGPMTFTEFLKGIGKEGLAEAIETFAWGGEGAPPRPHPLVHGRLLEALRLYRFIGGMPEAVRSYAESGDLRAVSAVQAGIVETYRDDFPSRHPEVPASVRCRKASALGRPLRRQPTSAANGAGGGAAASGGYTTNCCPCRSIWWSGCRISQPICVPKHESPVRY